MSNNYQILIQKLDAFIRKYYKNMLLRGGIYCAALLLASYITFTSLEYFGQFDTTGRTILFYSFILITTYLLVNYIAIPLLKLYHFGKVINHKQAAQIIGNHFEEVKDKLINVLQLEHLSSAGTNQLLLASIDQKSMELKPVPFSNAVNLGENKKYLKFLLIPLLLMIGIAITAPKIFTEGTHRLVNHNTYIAPVAPFQLEVSNASLEVLKNKDFNLQVAIQGDQLPEKVYVEYNGNKYPLSKNDRRNYSYTFKNVQNDQDFKLYASGFYSQEHELKVIPNPILTDFTVSIRYPAYLKKSDETLNNTGDLVLPEGTKLTWSIHAEDADYVYFIDSDSAFQLKAAAAQFNFSKTAKQNQGYAIIPSNSFVEFGDTVQYSLQVIPDKYPTINVTEKRDSTTDNRLYFKGEIADDYGFSGLTFHYQILTQIDSLPERNQVKTVNIPFNGAINMDEFFHFWNLEELNILPGDEISYYFTVWDNDGVNGRKPTKSNIKTFRSKTIKERNTETSKSNSEIKKNLSESISDAKQIQKDLEELKKKLADKKEIGWEEKQKMQELLDKQKELEKMVNEIQKENQQNNQQQNEYKQYSEEILKKQEQLQKLFDELMSDEMKEMMEKLQEMMDKLDKNMFENELDKMELSNKDLEKELDRSLELFKQMEFEQKLDEVKSKLEELADKQKELSEDTEQKKESNEELNKKQEELNQEFNELKKELDELEKMDQELERPNGMEDTKSQQEEISKEMENSSQQLQNNKNKKSSESQKKAADQMSEMAQQMAAMQQQSQNQGEDMDALRQLLDNLVHLSFEQEELMENYKKIDNKSPDYVALTQKQKKLKDDAEMIEDSLFALSKRVVQLESTINKEISLINSNMDKTIFYMAERQNPMASARQQYVMTSVNNLALLFDEALQQMQAQMRSQKPGEGSCDKPGGNGKPKPGFGNIKKMQDQLSKQLEQMKKAMEEGKMPGGKKEGSKDGMGMGKGGMSESLAKMAAQQAKIREELNKLKQSGGAPGLDGMSKMMEENETDIVNKRITQETINRQKEILTRLLESEKAEREREWDEKRESKEGVTKQASNPELYFDYNKEKEKEVDLLKTTPPNFNTFYKNKVTQYFQNISQ
ncbi:MAG: hypothetical protein KDD41_01810 [Flavobacteriales bacterium]|nr:hypothetical protein [Flavobacteriales bacterium]